MNSPGRKYRLKALRRAEIERLADGRYFASIPGFVGLWAEGKTAQAARRNLSARLPDWCEVHTKIGKNALPELV